MHKAIKFHKYLNAVMHSRLHHHLYAFVFLIARKTDMQGAPTIRYLQTLLLVVAQASRVCRGGNQHINSDVFISLRMELNSCYYFVVIHQVVVPCASSNCSRIS
jgi:hypothetical protein